MKIHSKLSKLSVRHERRRGLAALGEYARRVRREPLCVSRQLPPDVEHLAAMRCRTLCYGQWKLEKR
jgi:hypothetical protein